MGARLGILGGMGPLASAEFLCTLYRLNIAEVEQDSVACVLLSDPGVPDRTDAILAERTDLLTASLRQSLEELLSFGVDRIVITCITIHHVLDRLAPELRDRVISLIDLIIDELSRAQGAWMLLTTTGTRAARIFERNARWSSIADHVIRPDEADQTELQDWIYRLKRGERGDRCVGWLMDLQSRYGADGMIFGCTELHLLHRWLNPKGEHEPVLDPLTLVAGRLPCLLDAGGSRPREPILLQREGGVS